MRSVERSIFARTLLSAAISISAAAALAAAIALAQDNPPAAGAGAQQGGGGWPRPVGEYEGVTPGKAHVPDHLPGRPGERPTLVTWPGFQQRPDGASRFFVQTTSPVQTETRPERGRIVIVLKRVRLPVRNNRRPLETMFFNTPVTRARMERRRHDAAFVLELRADVTPRVTSERGANGYNFIFVEFPSGNWRPANVQAPQPPGGGGVTRSSGDLRSGGTVRIRGGYGGGGAGTGASGGGVGPAP